MTQWTLTKFTCALLGTALLLPAADDDKAKDVHERLTAADTAFREIMGADNGIPHDLLERAQCAIIVPGMKKGAFLVGAKYGKGFITCRGKNDRGWSAPGNIRIEGGSFGLQIGGGETDLFLLVMNQAGERILKSEFKIGGEASAMAGPVGRTVQANTDAYMRAQMLGWSRSRGAFAGLALEGSTLREDKDDNRALYGRELSNEQIVNGGTKIPAQAQPLITTLTRHSGKEVTSK